MISQSFSSAAFSIILSASAASAEVLVGIAAPFSGSALPTGEQVEIGALKAINDLNANGGVLGQQIVTSSVDDACDGQQAAAAAKQLVAEGVQFVIGHACSSGSIAGGPIYAVDNIIMMSPASTNPRVTDAGLKNVFRVIGRDDEQGAIAGNFLADEFTGKNIAILHDQSAYGQGLAEITKARLNERGVAEALFETYAPDQTAYTDLIEMMVNAEIEVIYIGGYQGDAGIIIREAKVRSPDIVLVSGDALASEDFPFIAGDAGIGSYFTFGPDARSTSAAVSVVASFRDDDDFEPTGYTLYSYAAVQAWAQAVENAGTFDGGAVARILREEQFETVLGAIGFDHKGDVTGLTSFVWNQIGEEGYAPVD
jgi:branched-chain amino acid transport system substrate-binding protein